MSPVGERITVVLPDPTGARYGMPTYPWGQAPTHLATRRQLARQGLRKNGHDPVAQLLRPRRRRPYQPLRAYLYDTRTAAPRRPWTPAKQAAVLTAARARRRCTGPCGTTGLDYIPRQAGQYAGWCNTCIDNQQTGRRSSCRAA